MADPLAKHLVLAALAMTLTASAQPGLPQFPSGLRQAALQSLARDGGQTQVWVEQRVSSSDGPGGQFGWSVAIDGTTALIGATLADVGPSVNQGAVYVFEEADGVWSETQRLTASDGAPDDFFGFSVAIDDGTILVGSLYTAGNRGAVYVFTESGGVWSQSQKLIASDGASGHEFGVSVGLDGATAVVGAQYAAGGNGAAYVFTRSGATWSEATILTASDGEQMDQFGGAVALSSATIIVGAESASVGDSTGQGAAYVFTGPTWSQLQKLTASDGTAGDGFGQALAIDGETAIVGAYFADVSGQAFRGAAYVYQRQAVVWAQVQKLTASNGSSSDYFGVGVALSDTTAFIGALYAAPYQGGTAYVYYDDGATWSEAWRLTPSDGHTDDAFAQVVAVDGGRALAGAFPGQGGGYFFTATDPPHAAVSTTTVTATVETGQSTVAYFSLLNEAGPESANLTFEISTSAAQAESIRTERTPAPQGDGFGTAPGVSPPSTYVVVDGQPIAIRRGEAVTLTHSVSQTIVPGVGVACNTEGVGTAENSYWRVFDLADYDLADLDVASVDVAMETASLTGTVTSTVRLYRLEGVLNTANLTLVGEATFELDSATGLIVNVPVTGSFGGNDVLVVEWFIPDLRPIGGTFFPGANSEGETAPGYISSFSCKLLQPTPFASIGFPQTHLVMNVHGTGTPALVSASPREGAIAPGGAQEITLTIDASQTAPGSYAWVATVVTNDPDVPEIEVDIDVTVGAVSTEEGTAPRAFSLAPVRPNPGSGVMVVPFEMPTPTHVRIAVYDAAGRRVVTLVNAERPAGRHEVVWDARHVSAGLYVAQLEAAGVRASARVVVTR